MTAIVEMHAVTRRFVRGAESVTALDAMSAEIRTGEVTVVAGPSGSGKTTLLYVIAGHEQPDTGSLWISVGDNGRDLGFVPQALALMEELSVRENVELPAMLRSGAGYTTDDLLDMLEIAHLADRLPGQISGGEQQRVAIGRALRLSPLLLVADEPTGHQDPARVRLVLDVFQRHARAGNAVLVSSHDEEIIAAADRVMTLSDGRLVSDVRAK